MTAPSSAADSLFTLAPPPAETLTFPLGWLLENACGPIRYRAAAEVARLPADVLQKMEWLPYAYRPALRIALTQQLDGTWNESMLTLPARNSVDFANIGTMNAVRRLVEYGWSNESPPLAQARRILFRLLAEDNDPGYLFEFAPKAKTTKPYDAADSFCARRRHLCWRRRGTRLIRVSAVLQDESSSVSTRT